MAHAEILALQEWLGLSYKDAAHCLYMAEMERLKADESSYKVNRILRDKSKEALEKALKSVTELENDKFDILIPSGDSAEPS